MPRQAQRQDSDTVAELEQLNRDFYAWLDNSGYQLLVNKIVDKTFTPGDLRHALWQAWKSSPGKGGAASPQTSLDDAPSDAAQSPDSQCATRKLSGSVRAASQLGPYIKEPDGGFSQ